MKAETDLYCPGCGDKIWNKGDVLRSLFFTRSEERCCNCDTMLRRRTPGGQSDPFNFITHPPILKRIDYQCGCWFLFDVTKEQWWKIKDYVICDNHVDEALRPSTPKVNKS